MCSGLFKTKESKMEILSGNKETSLDGIEFVKIGELTTKTSNQFYISPSGKMVTFAFSGNFLTLKVQIVNPATKKDLAKAKKALKRLGVCNYEPYKE
jgi:hypothetical protein